MIKLILICFAFLIITIGQTYAMDSFEKDIINTASGNIEIVFIGHGSLLIKYKGKNIYIDPFSKLTDFTKLQKADIIIITHEHYDHLDAEAIQAITYKETILILTYKSSLKVSGGIVMRNGDSRIELGIKIEAVPAYNIKNKRESGDPFHPKGEGNGYVLTFGDKRIYIAGDTENIPEMKMLKNIDIAFLPMNLPFTMTPEMTSDAARSFIPGILYPYHYGETDTSIIKKLLDNTDIEVRIRKMK